jgi:hypothetical protein
MQNNNWTDHKQPAGPTTRKALDVHLIAVILNPSDTSHTLRSKTNSAGITRKVSQLADPLGTIRSKI